MNRLGQNQRELYVEYDVEQASQGVSAQVEACGQAGGNVVVKMVSEVIDAKGAWVAQLDIMIQREEREEPREILRLIRLEELKHVKLLSGLALASISDSPELEDLGTVIEYGRAAKLKLKSAEFVRRIYYAFNDTPTRDILFEIICDDTNNAIRFTLLVVDAS